MTAAAQLTLFISSFCPLFVVLGLLQSFGKGLASYVCYAIAVAGPILLTLVGLRARRFAEQTLRATTSQARDADVLAYLATYIVPFASIAVDTARERIALGVFVAVVSLLYVRANLFYTNPLLAAIGYRLFEVTTPSGMTVVLVTRRKFLAPDTALRARRVSDYVHWEAA